MELTEGKALRLRQQGSTDALKWFMGKYTPYVSTIIYNIIGSCMSSADVEEVASDVFFALSHTGFIKFDAAVNHTVILFFEIGIEGFGNAVHLGLQIGLIPQDQPNPTIIQNIHIIDI